MTHWESTEEIKASTRVLRRRTARAEVQDQLAELNSKGSDKSQGND